MKKSSVFVLSLCLLHLCACGSSKSQAEVPTVNGILTKYVNALGGRAAISDLTTRTSSGTLELRVGSEQRQGTAASYAKAPNKYISIISIPNFGEIRRAFDGNIGWVRQSNAAPEVMSGQELAQARRRAEFYIAVKLAQLYPNLILKGQEDVNGHPAYLLESDTGGGSFIRMYFDLTSGLLVREDEDNSTPAGRDLFQAYFEDYRDVQGVKYPFTVRQIHSNTTFTIHLSEMLVNQPIDDAIFSKPAK